VAAAVVLPWALWSGLLAQATHIPAAWHYLDWSTLLASLPSDNPAAWTTALIGFAWFAAAWLLGGRLPDRCRRPMVEGTAGLWFATAWLTLSYVSFAVLVPAASYFVERLKLVVAVPGLLLIALVVLAVSRVVGPSWGFLPVAGLTGLLVVAGQTPPQLPDEGHDTSFEDRLRSIRSRDLSRGGRIFATPNEHLILTYYSGRPVQSIAPVRKEWLDRFPGDLLIVEGPVYDWPRMTEVQDAARRVGVELSPAEAQDWAYRIPARVTALALLGSGTQVVPPPPAPNAFDFALVDTVKTDTRQKMTGFVAGTPLGRFAKPANWGEWRRAFFYWFSDSQARGGAGLNYAACRRSALATVYTDGFAALDCHRQPPAPIPTTVAAVPAPPTATALVTAPPPGLPAPGAHRAGVR
jgi:hypothetical protein